MRGISSCPSSTRLGEEGAHSTKSAVQVQQEAAHVIAQGGGIQCYFPQKPDGSLALWQAVRRLFPEPLVEVQGSHAVDVVARRTGEVLRVHLLSTAGPHGDPQIHAFDEAPTDYQPAMKSPTS